MPIQVQVILRNTNHNGIQALVPAVNWSATTGVDRDDALVQVQEMILGYMFAAQMKSLPSITFDLSILDLLFPDEEPVSKQFESVMVTVTPAYELPAGPMEATDLPNLQRPIDD
jgi:hypothetical protein